MIWFIVGFLCGITCTFTVALIAASSDDSRKEEEKDWRG